MALSTYAELQAAVSAHLFDRSDLSAVIPDFIRLAEAQMQRRLRTHNQITRTAITLNAQYADLPADHLETIRVTADKRPLESVSTDALAELRQSDDTAREPRYMAHTGAQIELWPTPGQSYTGAIEYYATIPALANDNTSNWILASHPDAYLYGALIHAGRFLDDEALIARSQDLFVDAVAAIQAESNRQRFPGPMKQQFKPGRQ